MYLIKIEIICEKFLLYLLHISDYRGRFFDSIRSIRVFLRYLLSLFCSAENPLKINSVAFLVI